MAKTSKKKVAKKSVNKVVESKLIVKPDMVVEKATRPEDMESNKNVQVTKSTVPIVSGTDALIKISIFSPDHKPMGLEIKIPNITGCTPMHKRSPQEIMPHIMAGLIRKYGLTVKKVK